MPLRQRSWAEMQGCGPTNAKLKGDGKTQSGLAAIWHWQGLQEKEEAQSGLAASDGGGRTRRRRQSGLAAIWVEEALQEKEEAQSDLAAISVEGRWRWKDEEE